MIRFALWKMDGRKQVWKARKSRRWNCWDLVVGWGLYVWWGS